ncbi:MAG: 50S ribosomal protein L18 [bacterium]
MINKKSKNKKRIIRHKRVRKKVFGTTERPRVCVTRSLNNMYAQIINDEEGKTLLSCSTLSKEVQEKVKKKGGNKDAASVVGEVMAEKAKAKGIKKVVFDRAGHIYHGRIKALAEGLRKGGLEL